MGKKAMRIADRKYAAERRNAAPAVNERRSVGALESA
jgi:hypothetical protein